MLKYMFLFLIPILGISQDNEYAIDRVMDEYYQILKTEGYAPSFDKDNDIEFKKEGRKFYVMRPEYVKHFKMITGMKNNEGCNSLKLHKALTYASNETRFAKAVIDDETCQTIIFRSNLLYTGKDTDELIYQAIIGLNYCVQKFNERFWE